MNRSEHLQWCKDRALAYVGTNNGEAIASMVSDLGKHPETQSSLAMAALIVTVNLDDDMAVAKFINDFN